MADLVGAQLLAVEDLRAGYTGPVIGPVSFALERGEVVGLGGSNGAGKSTLLKAITGMSRVFGGTIRRAPGLRVTHHAQRPERPPELPLLGRELLGLLDAQMEHAPERVQGLLNRPVRSMSGGQFQFLQAWACLTCDADLVLLDEPTNNLDRGAIDTLSAILADVASTRCVLLVSHEVEFLRAHCHRIMDLEA